MSVRYLHPDKVHSVTTILRGKKKAKPAADGLTMIERMAREMSAKGVKRGR